MIAHGPVELSAVRAYAALPEVPSGRGVVVLPDVRGLHPFYEDLVRRLGQTGFTAMAIDYYGRTADSTGSSFDWRDHLPRVRPEHVEADVAEAMRSFSGQVFTLGFCFGGGHSWRLAASGLDLAGAIGFYGLPELVEPVVSDISRPLLMLLAGEDQETSRSRYDHLMARLDECAKPYRAHVYEGAPHSFFDRSLPGWQDVCEDAWERLLAFTRSVDGVGEHGLDPRAARDVDGQGPVDSGGVAGDVPVRDMDTQVTDE
ncbi:dienelactone hydrolase family protein [Embleya sp. NPDC001921]